MVWVLPSTQATFQGPHDTRISSLIDKLGMVGAFSSPHPTNHPPPETLHGTQGSTRMADIRRVSLGIHYSHDMPTSSHWGFPFADKWSAIATVMLYGSVSLFRQPRMMFEGVETLGNPYPRAKIPLSA